MYRTESIRAARRPRMPTLFIDPAQRSAAFDAGDDAARAVWLQRLREQAALVEVAVHDETGDSEDLLLVYRAESAPVDHAGGAILFRRARSAPRQPAPSPAVRNLAQVLFDSLRTDAPNAPLVAHLALALRAILPSPGAAEDAAPAPSRGGLAAWQERKAVAYMEARLEQSFPVAEVAAVCGLSVNHFSRAFRRSTGKPPHRWLLERRIDKARQLLRSSDMTLADIALACGFAEQSHFTRVFTRLVGMPPGAWRRATD
jgi:AraC family transcriptional regulator